MLTFRSGGWVLVLAVAMVAAIAAWRIGVIVMTYDQRAIGDGVTLDSYRFGLSSLTVSRDELRPIGRSLRRDGLPVLDMPERIAARDLPEPITKLNDVRKLLPTDRVIGVAIGDEAVAYPVWILDWHEIVNDVVGGRPIVVTWSGVSDSAVVFDRTVAGVERWFGFSGLILDSNLVFYDRGGRAGPAADHAASLWSQLRMRAISGPLAGTRLQALPFELVEWSAWLAEHPETTVILPQKHRKVVYKRRAYDTYHRDDELKFPADPLPDDGRLLKTPIILVQGEDGAWAETTAAALRSAPGLRDRPRAYAYWFAWYAAREGE